jgi:hypothetical protein
MIVSKYAPEAKSYILQKNIARYSPVDQTLSLPTGDKNFIHAIMKSNLIIIRNNIPKLSPTTSKKMINFLTALIRYQQTNISNNIQFL